MNILVIVLRFVHILSGVFWVGSSVLMGFFISPTVAATAETGQKFMSYLVTKARIHTAILIAAILTVLAGGTLYWIDSDGLTSAWQRSGAGIGFGIGGLFGVIGLIFGYFVGKNISILGNMGAKIQGKPTEEQMKTIQAAQKQLATVGPVSTVALILALICMATARYWVF